MKRGPIIAVAATTVLLGVTATVANEIADSGPAPAVAEAQVSCDDQPIQHAEVRAGEGYLQVARRLGGSGNGADVSYLQRQNAARTSPQANDTFSYKQCRLSTPASTTTTTTTAAPTTTKVPTTTTSTSTTAAPTTTTSTTTVLPTTTTTTSTSTTSTTLGPIPTTSPPTTSVPGGDTMFVETFDNNTGLSRFNHGVWHRDPYLVEMSQWQGDHDLACNGPETTRTIHRNAPDESFYVCKDHIMDSVGDTSGYSIGWFSPNAVFASVNSVSFDVNLTNLGNRKWWKVVVVSDSKYNTVLLPGGDLCCNAAQGFLFADAGSSGLPQRGNGLEGPDRLVATWGEDRTDNGSTYPAWFGIGDHHAPSNGGVSTATDPNDKATRFPVTLIDNHNGTITFTVAGVSNTQPGTMPPCPCRVVFEDHNYTPNKSSIPRVPNPYTWHWDNIIIR